MTRYALYFAPRQDGAWWKAGCQWVGRDPASGADLVQPAIANLPHLLLPKLTSDARRYGFHATLKAPFRLGNGFTESHLLAMAQAFCKTQQSLAIGPLAVDKLGSSLALLPTGPSTEIDALAMRCIRYFDLLRATPVDEEQKKYRDKGLTARQDRMLRRWGYPYTEEEFRFHITLTDSLSDVPQDAMAAIGAAAQAHFARPQAHETLRIADLTIFREDQPGSPFTVWQRMAFDPGGCQAALPRRGRLFYCVGSPGTGTQASLGWVREHLPENGDIVFARCTITRAALEGEPHEPVDESTFLQLAADGYFAMEWQADGLRYGIRRSIEVDLAIGRDVIVNGVRDHVPQLRSTFPDAQVIWLDSGENAAHDSPVTAARRRGHPLALAQDDCGVRIDNSGPVQAAGQRLLALFAQRDC